MTESELSREARRALAAGEFAAAEAACRRLAAATPGDGWPWAMLSEIALRKRDGEAALAHAHKAVSVAPKLLLGHVLLAKTWLHRGEPAEALKVAEAAPGDEAAPAEALDGLGAIFGMLGRHRQAQALFRRAVAAAPELPQFQFNLAATERMLGEFEPAEARCDALLARDPGNALVLSLRADLRIQTLERNHIAELEALLASPGSKTDPVMLHYALGKEYEDLGDDLSAFRHFSTGATLHRRRLNYQVAADLSVIERVMRTQTAAWLATAPRGTATVRPVFVAGLPRSGTTVVERIVAGHSSMASAGETGLFAAEIARAVRAARGGAPDPQLLGRRYIEAVTGFSVPKGQRFLDKTLQNYLYCGLIHAALPDARIVLLRRHPLDTCFALYKAHFAGTFPFSYDLGELAEYYLAFDRLARHWREILPSEVFREVHYEAVVADLAGESRRLLDFLGLPWEDGVLRFHESAAPSATASAVQVRRPLYATSVGRWRRHAEALEPLRARLAEHLPAEMLA